MAPSSRVPVSASEAPWQGWEQGSVSETGWMLGSSEESVGGGDGESVPGSEAGFSVLPPCASQRF